MKFIAIIGMPRSGSTIVCSFFNSLPRSAVWGELFRVMREKEEHRLKQMISTAKKDNLDLCGVKEIWDNNLKFDPVNFVQKYEDRFDLIFVLFRNPRKQWSSMYAIGHSNSISMPEYTNKYLEFYSLLGDKYVPFILEKFIASPELYVRELTGWAIPEKVVLQKYSGGGDPHAMTSKRIAKTDQRPPYSGRDLNRVSSVYESLL